MKNGIGAYGNMSRIEDFRCIYADLVCAIAGADNSRIVEAFSTVPREHYLGSGPWTISLFRGYVETPSNDPAYLYQNHVVAIDVARKLHNGKPAFLARLIDLLEPRVGDKVVHVGTGVGYYTAILAELVGPEGGVKGLEIDPVLAERSGENLSHYRHVEVSAASGSDLNFTDVDALFINAGATHPLSNWLDTLAPGGRMILPLTPDEGGGVVMKIKREADRYAASFESQIWIFDCDGARDSRAAQRLARALKKRNYQKVQTLRRDRHRRDADCWLHGQGWCFSFEPMVATE